MIGGERGGFDVKKSLTTNILENTASTMNDEIIIINEKS